jgi:hypothetical protein
MQLGSIEAAITFVIAFVMHISQERTIAASTINDCLHLFHVNLLLHDAYSKEQE